MAKKVAVTRLASAMRYWMSVSRVTQKEAAEDIGCCESTLSRFINGTGTPDGPTMLRITLWMMEPDE